jgi:hypothetical protein
MWIGFLASAALVRPAAAKLRVESLQLVAGFGVEENASPEREILALWKRYLTEPSDSLRATLWSAPERASGPGYDLVGPYVYQGFTRFTVVDVGPAAGLPETYVIRTLVSAVEDSTLDVRPLAFYRVYATREDDRWVLANALPRMTRDWRRKTTGKVTFVCPAAHEFDTRKARATSAFADSLAKAFELPEPDPITYYFTDNLPETMRALEVEFFPLGGDVVGGRSNALQRHVYIGSPTHGEAPSRSDRALHGLRNAKPVFLRRSPMGALERLVGRGGLALAVGLVAAGCGSDQTAREYASEQQRVAANLANFDDLDYNVFSNQKWAELHRSHSQAVTVH